MQLQVYEIQITPLKFLGMGVELFTITSYGRLAIGSFVCIQQFLNSDRRVKLPGWGPVPIREVGKSFPTHWHSLHDMFSLIKMRAAETHHYSKFHDRDIIPEAHSVKIPIPLLTWVLLKPLQMKKLKCWSGTLKLNEFNSNLHIWHCCSRIAESSICAEKSIF